MRVLLIDLNPFMAPVTPISLGHLGAVLKVAGHDVEVLSLGSNSSFSPRGFVDYIKDNPPRLVGFGTYQQNISHVRAIARMVKQASPETRVVLGGPQATFMPDASLSAMPEIDHLSRGEGELVIQAVAEAVDAGASDQPIVGATSRTAVGECVTGPMVEGPEHLDDYPSPWLTGVLDPAAMDESIMLTSRGCPNNCCFCYTPAAFGIAYVARKGTGRLWFADPNFSFSEARVVAILEGILHREIPVSMWVETRADMLTPGLTDLLKRAGVHSIAMGLESASPNVYPALHKGIEPERIGRAARTALEAGLDVELFSQFALPNETREDALHTLEFVKNCGVKIRGNSNAQQMQLYFGAELYADYEERGIKPLRDHLPPYLAIGAAFETDWMSGREIKEVESAWRAESLDGGKRIVS
jgi:radical SAM superfamily enzyme YgiQ (UPF0313 family)